MAQAASVNRTVDAAPSSLPDTDLAGFEHRYATVNGVRLHYVTGGNTDGDAVVLLAGFPESWYAWRHVMPRLGERFRIIAPDLPGQGDSDCPEQGYDTQALAEAAHGLLQASGVASYHLVGHDVGAWVAYAYAHLFGGEVRRLALLDAGIPGVTLPEATPVAPDKAWRTWHFAFHTIPDLPEALIAGREHQYLDWFLRRKAANPQIFSDAALQEYLRVLTRPGGLRAGLAYYRSADLSARQNKAMGEKGRLAMPVIGIGSDQGSIADMAGPLRPFCEDVVGATISNSGHFIPEEQPEALADELARFFGRSGGGRPKRREPDHSS